MESFFILSLLTIDSLNFHASVRSQEVEQSPQSLILQEEEDVTINCSFSKTLYSIQWYWQKHGEGPVFFMMLTKDGEEL
ncbi:hypothetical protein HPG69_002124 [Diceros bicornis minor]|uniref:Immunoglobulin V-set domain-containing protein n=1 Tax=Diceros bicornis minor TaxID=77932 RepID=A0A7J7FC90_DICBM|nr:hypothetical protein HPG69_002124 [Diceros bicornis minor]